MNSAKHRKFLAVFSIESVPAPPPSLHLPSIPRSRAPHNPARRYGPEVVNELVRIRKQLKNDGWDYGPETIHYEATIQDTFPGERVPSIATIARLLSGVGHVDRNPRKRPKSSYLPFARSTAMALWQLDAFEYRTGDGKVGTVYQLTDDATRYDVGSWAIDFAQFHGRMFIMTENRHVSTQQGWPRPGHAFTYRTEIDLDGFERFEYELSVPAGADQMDASNVIVGRIGGVNAADIELRKELYFVIGSITVASGHVEAAMKRLILTLQGNKTRQFSLVDKTWSDLHKILTKECGKSDSNPTTNTMRQDLAAHLLWAEDRKLKSHRDNFIHGSTWDYAMPLVLLSRFHRKEDGTQLIFTMEQIRNIAGELSDYARRLENLLHGVWHEAMLPELAQVPGYAAFTRRNVTIAPADE